jgi:hypothetical protein
MISPYELAKDAYEDFCDNHGAEPYPCSELNSWTKRAQTGVIVHLQSTWNHPLAVVGIVDGQVTTFRAIT